MSAQGRRAPVIIAVDGRSGAGKSTLALELATRLRQHRSVSLFHLEDVYPGWDGLEAAIRTYSEDILPALAAGQDAEWRAWDWETGAFGEVRRTAAADVVVVEGVGVTAAAGRHLLSASVWLDGDAAMRRERALARDGETYRPFWDRWAAQEEEWLAYDDARAAADVVAEAGAPAVFEATLSALLAVPALQDVLRPELLQARALTQRVRRFELAGPTAGAAVFARLSAGDAPAALLEASNPEAEDASERNRFSVLAFAGGLAGEAGPGAVASSATSAETESAPGGSTTTVVTHRLDAGGSPLTTARFGSATARIRGGFGGWLARWWDTSSPGVQGGSLLTGPGAASLEASGCSFRLGWVGWLGYELKRESGGSTVASPTPDSLLFRADRAVVIDHRDGMAWSLEAGDKSTIDAVDSSTYWERSVGAALGASAGVVPTVPPLPEAPAFACRNTAEDYRAKVRAAQAEIREGNSYEVCLTTALHAEAPGNWDPWSAYLRLRDRNPAPFAAYLRVDDLAVASTSPERFLKIGADGWMRAEPIKGTRRRGASPAEDSALREELASSAKDRAENIMIVDLLRNDLVRNANPETLNVPRLCAIESYATVHQMVSTIDARLRPDASRAEAVLAAFPPGSMTGAPKISTMSILDTLEGGRPRGLYSGAIGYFADSGACDLSVVIRTLVMEHDGGAWHLSLGVGGAVTADSDPEGEWDEVRAKAFGVLSALGSEFPG